MSPEDLDLLKRAANEGLLRKLRKPSHPGIRARVSMTGKLSMKRADFVELIKACEGIWDEHPTYGTDFLIVGDTSIHGRTAKMREAESRGVQIISENRFIELITPEREKTVEEVRGW